MLNGLTFKHFPEKAATAQSNTAATFRSSLLHVIHSMHRGEDTIRPNEPVRVIFARQRTEASARIRCARVAVMAVASAETAERDWSVCCSAVLLHHECCRSFANATALWFNVHLLECTSSDVQDSVPALQVPTQ